jgi:hypothetical protein
MSTKQSVSPKFELVYDSSKKPTALHAATEPPCWRNHMRVATPDELERLRPEPVCKHCAARLARLAAKAEAEKVQPKPKRAARKFEPVQPTKPVEATTPKAQVTA